MKEIEPGRKQRLDPSVRELLLGSIEFGLKMKFGNRGLRILPEISLIQDVNLLGAILTRRSSSKYTLMSCIQSTSSRASSMGFYKDC